jgi:Zn-dependent protease with chaperone function
MHYVALAAAYILAKLPLAGPDPGGPWPWLGAAALPVAALLLGAGLIAFLSRALEDSRRNWPRLGAILVRSVLLYRLALVALFGLVAHRLGWGAVASNVAVPLLDDVLLMLPYACAALISQAALYPLLFDPATQTMRRGMALETRELALLMLVILPGGRAVTAVLHGWPQGQPLLGWAALAGLTAGCCLLLPLYLRLLWRLQSLPSGSLRSRLGALAVRAGFRCREMYVWDTGGARNLNAAVTGVLPWLRYVLFTKEMTTRLAPEEMDAVLAHEMGHVQRNHGLFGAAAGAGWVLSFLGIAHAWAAHPLGVMAALAVHAGAFLLFLMAQKRLFEKEADLYAADLIGDAALYCKTLEKVAGLSGDIGDHASLTHGSVAARVRGVKAATDSPLERDSFGRKLFLLKGLSIALGAAGVAAAIPFFVSIARY